MVDQMERACASVKGRSEAPADRAGQARHDTYKWEQDTHDAIPEDHVEQQLFVGPPGAAGRPAQLVRLRVVEQRVELAPGTLELGVHRTLRVGRTIHLLTASGPGATCDCAP